MISKTNYIIGVDPGLNGGICLLKNNLLVNCIKPVVVNGWISYLESIKNIKNLLKSSGFVNENILLLIEKPYILPKQHGNEKIWRNYQTLFLILESFGSVIEVRPQVWQKKLGFRKGVNTKKESIKLAMSLNKSFVWKKKLKKGFSKNDDDGLTDAFCIAYYGSLL